MEKDQTLSLDQWPDSKVQPAAAASEPPQEGMSQCQASGFEPMSQVKQTMCPDCSAPLRKRPRLDVQEKPGATSDDQQPLLIHGLSVERYRAIYNSVLEPSVLSALSTCGNAEYVTRTLELKQRLWAALCRPQLRETVMEDGRVEVTEIFDLT